MTEKENRSLNFDQFKNVDLTTGPFLNIKNGFEYIFRLLTNEEIREVWESFDGREPQKRYIFQIRLISVAKAHSETDEKLNKLYDAYRTQFQAEKPEKYKAIMNLQEGREYNMKLPPTGAAALQKCCTVCNKDGPIRLIRIGVTFKTKYIFEGDPIEPQ